MKGRRVYAPPLPVHVGRGICRLARAYRQRVEVEAKWDINGDVWPLAVIWPDGRRFPIHRVATRERAVDKETGEKGYCYTCYVESITGTLARYVYRLGRYWYVYPQPRRGIETA